MSEDTSWIRRAADHSARSDDTLPPPGWIRGRAYETSGGWRRAEASWFRRGLVHFAVLFVAATLVGMVAACGSGAVEGPDDEASSEDGGGGNSGSGGGNTGGNGDGGGTTGGNGRGNGGGTDNGGSGGGDEFSWNLPGGDLSTDQIGEASTACRLGKCTRVKR